MCVGIGKLCVDNVLPRLVVVVVVVVQPRLPLEHINLLALRLSLQIMTDTQHSHVHVHQKPKRDSPASYYFSPPTQRFPRSLAVSVGVCLRELSGQLILRKNNK